jgi:dUTP pyrophosphatase
MESTIFDDEPVSLIIDRPTVGLQFVGKHISSYIPQYETLGSSGVDLRADIPEPITVEPGEIYMFGTGIQLNIPVGMEAQVRSRSGLAVKYGASVLHGVGTIDSDYTGEIAMIMSTIKPFTVKPGDRIAQMVFAKVSQVLFEMEVINDKSSRGSGGFGSTGV